MAKRDIWGMEGPFVSNPVWEQLRDRQDVFLDCSATRLRDSTYPPAARLATCKATMYPVSFSETLGLRPVAGRVMTPADDRRGCAGTAVLGYRFWQSEYGGRAVAGTAISLDNHPFEILGVIGPGFTGVDVGRQSDLYVPLCAETIIGGANGLLDGRRGGWLRIVGRPKPGISMNRVAARLKTLASPIAEATIPPNITPGQREIYLKRTFDVQVAAHGLSSIRRNIDRHSWC